MGILKGRVSRRDIGSPRTCIPVSRGIGPVVGAVCGTTDDDTADGPEHLQHLGARGSELDGDDFGAVGGRVGDKDAPRQPLEDLRDKKDGQRVAEVEDEDEGVEAHQADDGGPSVSDPAGERAGDKDPDQRAELSGDGEGGGPFGGDVVVAGVGVVVVGVVVAEVVDEGGQGDEVVDKEDVVRLHDLQWVSGEDGEVERAGRRTIQHDMTKAQKEAMG